MSRLTGFAIGGLTFFAAHAIETAAWAIWFGGAHNPWFLNSGRAIVFTMGCLFVVSLVAGAFRMSGFMIAAGAAAAMCVVLMWTGGSTIFPIVLTAGGLLVAASSLLGAWIGREGGELLRRRR